MLINESTVWCFSSSIEEDYYSSMLADWVEEVISCSSDEVKEAIKALWNNENSWNVIVERSFVDNSDWII